MTILIVASENSGKIAQFVSDQVELIKGSGTIVHIYGVKGHGFSGYLRNLKLLRAAIRVYKPDIVHAHYGLCGLLANMQRDIKVVTTYHGSDVNLLRNRLFSQVSIIFSTMNIFVSETLENKMYVPKRRSVVLPCGVDVNLFKPMNVFRKGLVPKVLFAGAFDNPVKNSKLAKNACELNGRVRLVELKNVPHNSVPQLMNECFALLLTSFSEGSPQVVKEALACNLPIVSVDVGDVKSLLGRLRGCFITAYSAVALSNAINACLRFGRLRHGRERLIKLGLDNGSVGKRLMKIYSSI